MLGVDDGTPPTVVPFDLTFTQPIALEQVGVAGVPMRALPDTGGEVLGASGIGNCLEAGLFETAAAFPLFAWVHDAVGLVEVFFGAGPDVLVALLVVVEAGDVAGVGVDDSGVAVGHPLGHDLRHAGAFFDPDRSGRPQVAHVGQFAQTRHGVGGQ